jgi:hypothetical protein
MCDNCTGGLTSLDNGFGQPEYCEKCVVGLGLAMTSLAKSMVETEQARADRAARLTDPFHVACRKAAKQQLDGCIMEHDRLEALYLALGGHSATAAAG